MRAVVVDIGAENIDRPLQLINKSNQFNLTTNRYTESEFLQRLLEAGMRAIGIRLLDRFGDNGLIAVVVTEVRGRSLWIEDWVMSCRVLGRGMEAVTMNEIAKIALQGGCDKVVGRFRPTKKNGLVANLLPGLGFSLVEESSEERIYSLELKTFVPCAHFIAQAL